MFIGVCTLCYTHVEHPICSLESCTPCYTCVCLSCAPDMFIGEIATLLCSSVFMFHMCFDFPYVYGVCYYNPTVLLELVTRCDIF